MIRIARQGSTQFSNIDFRIADVMSWNFRSETFDCIASLATFPHVPLRETLSRMRDSLKIGGVPAGARSIRARKKCIQAGRII